MAKAVGQTISAIMKSGVNRKRPFWMAEGYTSDDAAVAMQAAVMMSERFGQDMAIMADLAVVPLKDAEEPPLEIVRCPFALKHDKKEGKRFWYE